MAAAWSRRFLIGAELPPCNLIGAPSHMTPLPYLLSAAESLLFPSSSPAPQFLVATFFQPPSSMIKFVWILVWASSVWASDKKQFNSAVQATRHFNSHLPCPAPYLQLNAHTSV